MSIEFSRIVRAERVQDAGVASMLTLNLKSLGVHAAPLATLDDLRMKDPPFSGHPHAGTAAVTYVFRDSEGGLRSRASNGYDITVGAGGIVWTHAGRGIIHEEVPARPRQEVHALQLSVNLTAEHKLSVPKIMFLQDRDVPMLRNQTDDVVLVVVGAFEGKASPLEPADPFMLLDVQLHHRIEVPLPSSMNTVVYLTKGRLTAQLPGQSRQVSSGQAVAVSGGPAPLILETTQFAHLLILSGVAIAEPVVVQGPFMMNSRAQMESTIAQYRSGALGGLSPIPIEERPLPGNSDQRDGS